MTTWGCFIRLTGAAIALHVAYQSLVRQQLQTIPLFLQDPTLSPGRSGKRATSQRSCRPSFASTHSGRCPEWHGPCNCLRSCERPNAIGGSCRDFPSRLELPPFLGVSTMRFRLIGVGLVLLVTASTTGCCWWRPCGCCRGHCCGYAAPASEATVYGAGNGEAITSVPARVPVTSSSLAGTVGS